ncbi:MAG TPA: AlpA family phage regulatory protein [Parvularculaceae bacterium]|nr:AlpA family phage regulatory protein [Parvularculaceae bacterium]
MSAHETPKAGFYRLRKVLELIPVSRSTWYAGVKSGRYPAPVRISENIVAWRASDIHALIIAIAARAERRS